jgi:hypothetical protein
MAARLYAFTCGHLSDGSAVCLRSYGHTPGHPSLRVRTETGGEHLPGVVADVTGGVSGIGGASAAGVRRGAPRMAKETT